MRVEGILEFHNFEESIALRLRLRVARWNERMR